MTLLETRNDSEQVETKDGGTIEVRFDEYHAATTAALEASEKRADELELRLNRLTVGGGNFDTETKAAAAIKAEHSAFGLFIKSGDETELKALSAGSDPAGGYVVETQLQRSINQKIFDQSPIRRLARVITLTSGDGWSEPRDFDDLGAEWVAETGSRTETDNSELGMLNIPLNEVYAHQTVTQKLLDLAFVDIGAWIEGKISDKFGRTEGLAYVSGNGVGKPRGLMDYTKAATDDGTRALDVLQYVPSGTATTVADVNGQADGLKSLIWKLRAPYRANASWLMSSATASSLDRLKDANKNYIWKSSNTAGAPDELFGYPVEFEENMPAEAADAYPVAFGDFAKAYTIIDWAGIKSLRDPYTAKPNVIFYAYRRTGGGLSNSEAIKLLKCATS